jgi:hypothetical protein
MRTCRYIVTPCIVAKHDRCHRSSSVCETYIGDPFISFIAGITLSPILERTKMHTLVLHKDREDSDNHRIHRQVAFRPGEHIHINPVCIAELFCGCIKGV